MIRQSEILKAVQSKLKTIYNLPVYLDEVVENFISPCFFLKMLKKSEPDNVAANRNINKCMIVITYFAEKGVNNALELYDIKDAITQGFWRGLQIGRRYIHFYEISSETDGEEADIVYVYMNFNYYDSDAEENKDRNNEDVLIMEKFYQTEKIKGTKQYHCNEPESEE